MNKNLSRYQGAPPQDASGDRRIAGGPLYDRETIVQVLAEHGAEAVIAWTRKCRRDLQKLALAQDDMPALIREALDSGCFKNAEWCVEGQSGNWAACDAYTLHRHERVPATGHELMIEYYFKFAIGKTGRVLLLASCHLS